jgi:hypothetical protein
VAKTQQRCCQNPTVGISWQAKFILFAKITENARIFKLVGAKEFLRLALF